MSFCRLFTVSRQPQNPSISRSKRQLLCSVHWWCVSCWFWELSIFWWSSIKPENHSFIKTLTGGWIIRSRYFDIFSITRREFVTICMVRIFYSRKEQVVQCWMSTGTSSILYWKWTYRYQDSIEVWPTTITIYMKLSIKSCIEMFSCILSKISITQVFSSIFTKKEIII
jgi:hypothetical protein